MNDLSPIEQRQASRIPGADLISAIASAMGEVKRLSKDNRNTEQKYEFASVDDFLAMTGPICAKHGLVPMMDEEGADIIEKPGKYGPTFWVKYTFAITLYHKSGDAMPTVHRSVEVIRSGAQAAGSAQSYVLKQYLRGLFQIPTGDKDDPDFGGDDHSDRNQQRPTAPKQEAPKSEKHDRDPGAIAAGLIAGIAKVASIADLDAANTDGTKFAAAWQWLEDNHPEEAAGVKKAFDARKNALTDEIPF
ncbi:hypothetical protein D2T31_11900 [Sinirhodobacter populi]|uniref:Uncharacterized protein n=1 Tax=Paenirhodobacter populi TaxID=2306993 RepID=A0A443K7V5_9RHOB|nr:ERF family protein [Sinirhodobacter populi]RWR28810.1 hypothetical protein D2T31_11900 [Sinirhodobacter populi]